MEDRLRRLTLDAPGERLDRALVAAMPDVSRNQLQRLIREGQVLVDGEPAKARRRLEGGESVQVQLPPPLETTIVPESIPLDIRYEDDDLLLVNKPAGMVVHPSTGHYSGTLVNAVLAHCPDVLDVGGELRPGIVHRLDRDTSGLIVVAKNDRALNYMQAQFKARTVQKRYLALVEGQVQPPAALIDAPIGRDPSQRKKMAVITVRSQKFHARSAQTTYETVTSYDDFTLLSCELHTGRTHQIRVHLKYIGHPIVGDRAYGRRRPRLPISRQFLHAEMIGFKRPSDDAELTFHAELPAELQRVLDALAAD